VRSHRERTKNPHLGAVLSAVVPGRTVPTLLRKEQKRALRDQDGKLALDVLRHLLGARAAIGIDPRSSFPLTEGTFQAVAEKLGRRVGQKRARALRRRLEEEGILGDGGCYRQAYSNRAGAGAFIVRLYRLAAYAPALGRKRLSAPRASSRRVLKPKWWGHPLFGDYEGRPPPGWTKRRRERTASLDWMQGGIGSGLPPHTPKEVQQ
jgi:hypothetical protein